MEVSLTVNITFKVASSDLLVLPSLCMSSTDRSAPQGPGNAPPWSLLLLVPGAEPGAPETPRYLSTEWRNGPARPHAAA